MLFVTTNELTWYIIITQRPYFIWISLVFTWCPFSVLGPHSGYCAMCLLRHRSPLTVSPVFLVLMTLTVLRNPGLVFCMMPLSWDLSDVFLMIWLGAWAWGRKTTEVKYHSHWILPRAHAVNVVCHCWCWPWSPDWDGSSSFSISPLPNPHCLHYTPWKEVICVTNP